MDHEPAEPATSRRSLIRAAGVAGIAGAAAALAARPASAAPAPVPPNEADTALLQQAMLLELTASDLYQEALGAGLAADTAELIDVIAQNHRAYAQSIAGVAGLSATGRNEEVFESLSGQFADDSVLAAHTLEQTAVSTHTVLLGLYESAQAVNLTASILVVEARQATVLADIAGVTDLDIIFGDDQPPLDLAGATA